MASGVINFDSPEPRFGRSGSLNPSSGSKYGGSDPPGKNGHLEQGTLENVRRFLSDEDEGDLWMKTSRAPMQVNGIHKSSLLDETAKHEINRTSRFRADAGDSSRSFMHGEFGIEKGDNHLKKQISKRKDRSPSTSFFLAEHVSSFSGSCSPKRMLTCLVMVVLAIAIVGTVVVVSGEDNHGYTVPEGEDSGEVVPKAPPKEEGGKVEVEFPVDEERFHSILDYLVDSEVSVEKDLKTQNSPQSRAARWLSDEDEAQLSVGHFDMLQRYAMVTLFFSTTKVQQEWKKNDGWLTSSHICSWYGVKCGNHVPSTGALGKMSAAVGITPHVIHLNLTANNLNGELPPELSIMAKLKTLAIGGNKNLKGTIPTTLGKLHVLALLHLQENKLTGNIPSEIGGCTDLRDLHIDNNLLSGKIPTELSLLNSLHSFKITANRFTGPMPDVSSFKHLTDFWIDDNKFTGEIDPELSRVTTLKILRLNQNELVGTIPKSLGKLKKLVEFHFFNNHFKGEVPEDICEINTLHYIAGDCGIDESTDGEIECDCCTVCYR